MSTATLPADATDPWFQDRFAQRIGGAKFGKGTEIYKFELIKRAKRKALADHPERRMLDFGIGDPNSTSGFLVPMTFVFGARNIEPRNCFRTVRNANHEANALAVANRLVHAAANNNESLERLKQTASARASSSRAIRRPAKVATAAAPAAASACTAW
jgi:ABC-type phosphate/phosphonate transport system substrate-binding protein